MDQGLGLWRGVVVRIGDDLGDVSDDVFDLVGFIVPTTGLAGLLRRVPFRMTGDSASPSPSAPCPKPPSA